MPRKQPIPTAKPQPKKVCCADCRRFNRDTSGPSLNVTTGEYFMGLCPKLHADGAIIYDPKGNPIGGRVFADKPRICTDHLK